MKIGRFFYSVAKVFLFFLLVVAFTSCDKTDQAALFIEVAQKSGVSFRNQLTLTEEVNPYTFRNFFNGGGVAVGDVNNDGFLDLYFSGNQVSNKLYLNNGDFTFTDITEKAGVACNGSWSTGTTFADVNADGWLDIYVCKSGPPDTPNRHNELFINNGNLTFSEKSREFGLDVSGLSVQAVFFDFDRDHDLDCYLLTNSFRSVGAYDLVPGLRSISDPGGGGNKLFVNTGTRFVDHAEALGIHTSAIGFGLGVTLGDFNDDSWVDIFVSNDFFERDYLYINQAGRGFVDSLTSYFQSISTGSMGADFADLDNDGTSELFVTEMLPDSLSRRKTKTLFEGWERHQLGIQSGYHFQYSRNVLQKKVHPHFYSEIGRYASVAASEWSWGALLFDMDNDGWKDIYVANGIARDLLDRDYLAFSNDPENIRALIAKENQAVVKLINLMPTSTFVNYAWKNKTSLRFENVTESWGLAVASLSNGSAFGDFDNDGDLDLVVNCVNHPARLYRNQTDTAAQKSISFRFRGTRGNTLAVGTRVTLFSDSVRLTGDNFANRGYQSYSQLGVTIGIGNRSRIDSAVIIWPDNTDTVLYNLKGNSFFIIQQPESSEVGQSPSGQHPRLHLERRSERLFNHLATAPIDFNREPLLTQMYCNETPFILVSTSGKPEFYVGGGINQPGLLIYWNGISFQSKQIIHGGLGGEETKGAFFDVDGDRLDDLVIATGGRGFPAISDLQLDRVIFGVGSTNGRELKQYELPASGFATSSVVATDFDRDGDLDLVIGERFDSFIYGLGGGLHFYLNDGTGSYTDANPRQAVELSRIGMVTDLVADDLNQDGWPDLLVVGDWMPITFLKNNRGQFSVEQLPLEIPQNTSGWWHCIERADLNRDGRSDFILGNQGLNSFVKPGDRIWIGDFDSNGSMEQIYTTAHNGRHYPIHDRDELTARLPALKKSVLKYSAYSKKTIEDIFPGVDFKKIRHREVNWLASSVLLSGKSGKYELSALPKEAQFSSIYAVETGDFDFDGILDVVAGGNQFLIKPEFGRQDASAGWFFRGYQKKGKYVSGAGESLNIRGQIRDIAYLAVEKNINFLVFAKNGDELEIYEIQR